MLSSLSFLTLHMYKPGQQGGALGLRGGGIGDEGGGGGVHASQAVKWLLTGHLPSPQ